MIRQRSQRMVGVSWKANKKEDEVNKGDDGMGRCGQRNKVGRFVGQGGGGDGGNNNKVRGNIFSIPPLCALSELLFKTTT